MTATTKVNLSSPQDQLVERVCSSEADDDSGRYAIARDDINPGEIVLLAAPYAVALNPNEVVSATYAATNVEEWECTLPGTRVGQKVKKNNVPSDSCGYVAVIPCATFCCCCLRRIPTGTPLLNYETIELLSHLIADEHNECERKQWAEEQEASLRMNPEDMGQIELEGVGSEVKKLQKPSRSAKMRSRGYLSLKQKLIEAATARKGHVVDEGKRLGRALCDSSVDVSWPERIVEKYALEESTLARGVCGCAGCGVVVYCSKLCWLSFHVSHRTTGACRTLRDVYSPLMRAFMTRNTKGNKMVRTRNFRIDTWNPKYWVRRTTDEKAWEMLQLLLAALLIAQCAKEGYANNMESEDNTESGAVDGTEAEYCAEDNGNARPTTSESSASSKEFDHSNGGSPTSTVESGQNEGGKGISFAVDSVVPREVEAIRRARARCGTAVEILDCGVSEVEHVDGTSEGGPGLLHVSIEGHAVVGMGVDGSETHAIRCPRWREVAALVTNLSVLRKESRVAFRGYYHKFRQVVLPWIYHDDNAGRPLNVSQGFFDRLCGAVQCNNFGLFDPKESCIGVAVLPEASYFNHSCAPNLCRVMCKGGIGAFYALREIRKGEPLTICYVNVQETSTAERRRALLMAYRFYCQCKRCHGSKSADSERDSAAKEVNLCNACVAQGYIRPLPPTDAAVRDRWTMDSITAGECTVCHQRVPWGVF